MRNDQKRPEPSEPAEDRGPDPDPPDCELAQSVEVEDTEDPDLGPGWVPV